MAFIFAGLLAATADDVTKSSFLNILDAAGATLEDFTCEYEGDTIFPDKVGSGNSGKIGPNGLYDSYSGIFAERRDGAVKVEIFHRFFSSSGTITLESASILGDKSEHYMRSFDERGANGEISTGHYLRLQTMGSLALVVCRRVLRGFLQDENWSMKYEGTEVLDARQCNVVRFALRENANIEERFWIDLDRGGHVLKYESLANGGSVATRVSNVVLELFMDSKGTGVWLPVSGTYESLVSGGGKEAISYGSKATNLGTFKVLRETIKVNSGLNDKRFAVGFRKGDLVSDQLRRLQYEYGSQIDPAKTSKGLTRSDTEAMLNEQIRLADEQGGELKAASRARYGSDWSDWLPWSISAISMAVLCLVWLRNRRGRR